MDTLHTSDNRKKQVNPQFKDVSRFTRFIGQMDDKDKRLDPKKRKAKWIVVLSALFLLYMASFLLPTPDLSHTSLEPEGTILTSDSILSEILNSDKQKTLTFEMPVDSFENLLKKRIHENNAEAK